MYTVGSPADLISSVPVLLGFVPTQSLVLVGLEGTRRVGPVMYADLATARTQVERLAGLLAENHAVATFVVIVDSDSPGEHAALRAAAGQSLAEVGIEMLDTYIVDRIAKGGRWRYADSSDAGTLGDPAKSALAARTGTQIAKDRETLAATLLEADTARSQRVMAQVLTSQPTSRNETLAAATEAAALLGAGNPAPDDLLARVAAGLSDVTTRDALVAMVLSGKAKAVEMLWALQSTVLTGTYRAEALALHGTIAYLRGSGPKARILINAALELQPQHALSQLIFMALATGLPPKELRDGLTEIAELSADSIT